MNGAQKDWLQMFLVTPLCLVIIAFVFLAHGLMKLCGSKDGLMDSDEEKQWGHGPSDNE
jgi:hypothetical protein